MPCCFIGSQLQRSMQQFQLSLRTSLIVKMSNCFCNWFWIVAVFLKLLRLHPRMKLYFLCFTRSPTFGHILCFELDSKSLADGLTKMINNEDGMYCVHCSNTQNLIMYKCNNIVIPVNYKSNNLHNKWLWLCYCLFISMMDIVHCWSWIWTRRYLLSVAAEPEHSLSNLKQEEDDAQEAPANEEAHETSQSWCQVPDVIGIELILSGKTWCLHIKIKWCWPVSTPVGFLSALLNNFISPRDRIIVLILPSLIILSISNSWTWLYTLEYILSCSVAVSTLPGGQLSEHHCI